MEELINGVMVRTINDYCYADFGIWLKANGYKSKEETKENSIINDSEITISELEDEFLDWCDEHGIEAEM